MHLCVFSWTIAASTHRVIVYMGGRMEDRKQFLRKAAEELKDIGYGIYVDYGKLSIEHTKKLVCSDIELIIELFKKEFVNQDFELAQCYTGLIKSIGFINNIDVLDIDSMESLYEKGKLSSETMEKIWKSELPKSVSEVLNSFISRHVDSLFQESSYEQIIKLLSNPSYVPDNSINIMKRVISHFVDTRNFEYLEKVRYDHLQGSKYYLGGRKSHLFEMEFLKPLLEQLEKTDELLFKSLLRSILNGKFFTGSRFSLDDPLNNYIIDHAFRYADMIKTFVYNSCVYWDLYNTAILVISLRLLCKIVEDNMTSVLLDTIHDIIKDLIAKKDWVIDHYERSRKEDQALYGKQYIEKDIPFLTGCNFLYSSIISHINAFNDRDLQKIEEITLTVKKAIIRKIAEENSETDNEELKQINSFLDILSSNSVSKRLEIVKFGVKLKENLVHGSFLDNEIYSKFLACAITFKHEDAVSYLNEKLIEYYQFKRVSRFGGGIRSLLMNSILRFERFDVLEALLEPFTEKSKELDFIYSDLLDDINLFNNNDQHYASLSALVTNSELSDTHKLEILTHIIEDIYKEILNIDEDTYSKLHPVIWDFFMFLSNVRIVDIDEKMERTNRLIDVLMFIVCVRMNKKSSYEKITVEKNKKVIKDYWEFLERYTPRESNYEKYDKHKLEDRMRALSQIAEKYSNVDHPLLAMKLKIAKRIFFAVNIRYQAKVQAQKEDNIRIAERNRIMANLSHTVKNLIGTIIDPLENMRSSSEYRPVAIDNAIRGANVIRNLVNAMNQSFTGSLDDFKYDIAHASYEDSTSISNMVMDSLGYSISTMFDGKYFHKFMKNYYPGKSEYLKAKRKWESLPAQQNIEQIMAFLHENMLTAEVTVDQASDFIIGNDHGSSLKMLILIQEMMLNAVKYASFVPREHRFVRVAFIATDAEITFSVANSYCPDNKVKSTGLGLEIINNFAIILETKPNIEKKDDTYSVSITIQNLWSNQ